MRRNKKVVATAEPDFADEEGSDSRGGLDVEEEEDSGRGLLVAVNKHVINEDEDDEEEEAEKAEKCKLLLEPNSLCSPNKTKLLKS